ncbi:MAG: adenine methyltransferase [Proteobacteria bacterium]|nr:MAG: adenine methyltransferase [Pseudomonadota bacterium]
MKYMGSKRLMLQNGLGNLIRRRSASAERVIDLFSGAGYVSWFVATKTNRSVLAVDLQSYARDMAAAVIERTEPISDELLIPWINLSRREAELSPLFAEANRIEDAISAAHTPIEQVVDQARILCATSAGGQIWRAYGGHYFSPLQALLFDYLLLHLPQVEPFKTVCLAAVIEAASRCVASPGHTAQPFQPTATAAPHLLDAWRRDPVNYAVTSFHRIAPYHAQVQGRALVGNANDIAETLLPTDLVIVDPPYSGVQYSRFYHVLEAISRGTCGEVSGVGRYPSLAERPQSAYSNGGQSTHAITQLLERLADRGTSVILTFPAHECSNGLSGEDVIEIANRFFRVRKKVIAGRFSSLGGTNGVANRSARFDAQELALTLSPR